MKTYINSSPITFQQIIETIHKNINKNEEVKVTKTKSVKQLLHIYKDFCKLYNKNEISQDEIVERVCEDYNRGLN